MADEEGGQLFLVSTGTTQFLQFRELLLVKKLGHKQELGHALHFVRMLYRFQPY